MRLVGESLHHIRLGNETIAYRLVRAKRKSLGLQIGDDGLSVRAPHRASLFDVEAVLLEKANWIKSRLAYWRQCQSKLCALHTLLKETACLPILGRQYSVDFLPTNRRSKFDDNQDLILLAMPKPNSDIEWIDAATKVERLIKPIARSAFIDTAASVANRGDYPPFKILLSSAKHRWGSCNSKGELRLNWRLVFYHQKAIEYVVAHEVAHLKVMNHSPQFWAEVEKLMPGYREHHAYLADMHPDKVPISR